MLTLLNITIEQFTNFHPALPDSWKSLAIIITFFLIWVLSWLPFALLILIKGFKWQPIQPLPPEAKLPLLVPLYLLAPAIIWGLSLSIGTSLPQYGVVAIGPLTISLAWGLGLAILGLAIIFGAEIACGWSKWDIQKLKQLSQLVPTIFPIALFIGGVEELVFRGFLQTTLEQNLNHWLAAGLASTIFALLHLVWEQKETIPQLPGLWLMGMVLVLARDVDGGSIGLPWGLHAGWVWVMVCLDTAGVIDYTGQVSDMVTGKNQKPLAGGLGFACMLFTGISLLAFT